MNKIDEIYRVLSSFYGPQNWWPADSPLEVMVGAILTQNTNWTNVTKAIDNLKKSSKLDLVALHLIDAGELADLIRPSGYYNLKAKRLKNFVSMVYNEYEGSLELLIEDTVENSRKLLLEVKGIGQETADSILLYGCQKPVFVIDSYTHRILTRHNMIEEEVDYETLQALMVDSLPEDIGIYNEFHALIVKTAAQYCKKSRPRCDACPLNGFNW